MWEKDIDFTESGKQKHGHSKSNSMTEIMNIKIYKTLPAPHEDCKASVWYVADLMILYAEHIWRAFSQEKFFVCTDIMHELSGWN